jgi:hypothetical protein
MKVGPSGSAIRSLIPSHRELLRWKAVVVSVAENVGTMIPAGKVERGERKRTVGEVFEIAETMSELGAGTASGISSGDVLILPGRHPACRRRESSIGFGTERENLAGDAKGKAQAATARPKVPKRRRGADCLVVVMKRV